MTADRHGPKRTPTNAGSRQFNLVSPATRRSKKISLMMTRAGTLQMAQTDRLGDHDGETGVRGRQLVVSAGDQVEDQSWGKSSEYEAFFAPEEMASIAYAPAVGNHDRHYMFEDHFNLPNEMSVAGMDENGVLAQVKTTFRGQNNGTSQSHGNYIQATSDEIANSSESNGVTPNAKGSTTLRNAGKWKQKATTTIFMTMSFSSH